MNELEYQVKQIKQAVRLNFPKHLTLHLLDILEVYVGDDATETPKPQNMTADEPKTKEN